MDHQRQAVLQRQLHLEPKRLLLLGEKIPAPVEVEPHLSHPAKTNSFGRSGQITRHLLQILPPAGIVVDRGGVQPHHRAAQFRVLPRQSEHRPVGLGIHSREQNPPYPSGTGPGNRLVAVGIELRIVNMRMGIDQLQRHRCIAII